MNDEKYALNGSDTESSFDENYILKLKTKNFFITLILVVIVALVSSYITFKYVEIGAMSYANISQINKALDDANKNLENADISAEKSTKTIADTLKNFRNTIDKYYIGEVDEKSMLDSTIKGYINGLQDEYSEYMTAEEWEDYQASALGNYVGIGILMSMDKNDNIVVVSPIKGTPAEEAGILSGDIIVQVNDESTSGMDSSQVSSKVKGEAGTSVNLKLLRDNEYIDVTVERKEIKMYHVESELLDNNIGYIKLYTFDEGCSKEFEKAYMDLKNQGATKIIFDLRNNTGGLVNEALEIADYMIDKDKTVLITKDANDNKKYNKSNHDPKIDCPVVVLVNEYSASASEILTGALKDNEEAKIVGTVTYGKGVIQNVFELTDGSVLKLTVEEYFTPNETKINKVGITPDYEVEDVDQEEGEEEIDEQLNKAIEVINEM